MLYSLDWLRELTPFDRTADEVQAALTARGLTVDSVEESGGDHVLEIDVPANRPDCLGHRGVARELAAALGLAPPAPVPAAAPAKTRTGEPGVRVEIDAPDLCSRYTAAVVRGVRVGPSAPAVARRLERCGLRPINNVVDASNLVLLETGNPIHFFDLSLLRDATIHVRRAVDGERVRTLDDIERRLDANTLVISDGVDGGRVVALAGVMGGGDTEINDDTRDVLIEAAWFDPLAIRRAARRLGLHSDSSYRFERGVDPDGVLAARDLALRLLEELAGGEIDSNAFVDCHPRPWQPCPLELRTDQLQRLLGYQPRDEETLSALEALNFAPRRAGEGRIEVTPPSFRVDIEGEADLVEEVARHLGYDRIPLRRPEMIVENPARGASQIEECGRDILSHLGFQEAFGYAMIGPDEDQPFVPEGTPSPLSLANPIAESMALLRRSLLPGLLRSVDRNLRRGVRGVRLFEVGRVFLDRGDGDFPDEPLHVGLAWSGIRQRPHWSSEATLVDLYDIAGAVEALLHGLRLGSGLRRHAGAPEAFHPGRSLSWRDTGGRTLGHCGELSPQLAGSLSQPVLMAEIELDTALGNRLDTPQYRRLPRLGAVTRDLALVLDPDRTCEEVFSVLGQVDSPVPASFAAVDRYEGPPLGPRQSSLTVRVTLQPFETSLTEDAIEGYRTALIERLRERLGIEVRGGETPPA